MKDIAKSVKAKLQNIAQKEGLVFQTLITRYIYERLLYRLSVSDYMEHFYLKGGALLFAIEQSHPRPTLDIDFLGVKIKNDLSNMKNIFTEICSIPCESDGVNFDIASISTINIAEEKHYKGVRVSITANLDSIKQIMKIDIGFGDIVVPEAKEMKYPCYMGEVPQVSIMAYSKESIIAEKFHAMIELSETNSRLKDFYDIYQLLSNHQIDRKNLSDAIVSTFKNRSTQYQENHILFSNLFMNDTTRIVQWNNFLKKIKFPTALEFSEVMTKITKELQPIYKELK
ncbi:MAG: nucleotidyl transferase AbiEii/AbiGii toxin family protein [Rikenellaceae bacterium]